MPIYQVIVLALVQGITEFLPISSTAHLALAPWLFGWKDPGLTFDIALHIGTLAAVLLYFFGDWVELIGRGFGLRIGNDPDLKQNPRLLWFLAVATIPVGIAGWVFKEQAETTWRNPYIIATMLIAVGILMAVAERAGRRQKHIGLVSPIDAITIGISQALAVVPGTSRSGITIAAGLFRDLDRQTAARFSFLLSTPAIAGAALKDFHDVMKHGGIAPDMRLPFALGIVISGITGCIAIALLLKYLRRRSLAFFVYYRIIFGIIVIALAALFRFSGR